MKYFYLVVVFVLTFIAAYLLSPIFIPITEAAVACPVGYTCTKIVAKAAPPKLTEDQKADLIEQYSNEFMSLSNKIEDVAKNAPRIKYGDYWYDIWQQPVLPQNRKFKTQIEKYQKRMYEIADTLSAIYKGTYELPQ